MFFAAKNLTDTTVVSCAVPWEFQPTEILSQQIRKDKQTRQEWYANSATQHQFYSGIEGLNSTQRPSRDNPPHAIHAFVADYDVAIPDARIEEVLKTLPVPPSYVETSLGGGRRLVWICPRPVFTENYEFCAFILKEAEPWLQLQSLPGLDSQAFYAPSRLYCNGCEWKSVGPPIPEDKLQAFFVHCGRRFRFKPTDSATVPLDLVATELARKFPGFTWPAEFAADTQGPSFWIPESTSPLSAIVKPGGLFTFSAHAAKPFYSWSDILGAEFVKGFKESSIAKATDDIWWDSKRYYKKKEGHYTCIERGEMNIYFRVTCKLSEKPDSSNASPLEQALDHIHNHQNILGAAPFVLCRPGPLIFQGRRVLNTYHGSPIEPAAEPQIWGLSGNFPFHSRLFDWEFTPPEQLPYFLAWWKYYYTSAYNWTPLPGQNIILRGGPGVGKTYINRHLIGHSVGGFVDAAPLLVGGGDFTAQFLASPHWCLDDDTPLSSAHSIQEVQSRLKKITANQEFLHNQKFEKACMTRWSGRAGITTNLDYQSGRMAVMDDSSADKICLFRCQAEATFPFPLRAEQLHLRDLELPFFLRWLLDWKVPDYIQTDSRYGFKAYHEPTLLEQTQQSSPSASFKEILLAALAEHFQINPNAKEWSGPTSQVLRLLLSTPANAEIIRGLRLEQANRHLEQIQREGVLNCTAHTGKMNTRVWTFSRNGIFSN